MVSRRDALRLPLCVLPWVGLTGSLGGPLTAWAQTRSTAGRSRQRVVGVAVDPGTQRHLYTEVHEQVLSADGSVLTGTTTYHASSGQEIGRKTLDYRQNRTVPVFRMEMPGPGYAEGIRQVKGSVEVFKDDKGRTRSKTLPLDDGLVAADSGFNQLLIDQWPALQRGDALSFQLIVAGQTDAYRFQARKVGEGSFEGERTLRLRVAPDSMLRWLVDPIDLVYGTAPPRLLEYRGVSNVIDPATGEVYRRVRVHYPSQLPPEALAALSTLGHNGAPAAGPSSTRHTER
jgi:hypothetical protein